MYYNYESLLSRNALLNFVIGERGVGKTYGAKKYCVKDFIKNGNQFIYLRRYNTELDTACDTFFSALQANGDFDDLEFSVKKSNGLTKFMCDGEIIGYGAALSTALILKSTEFSKVKTIIFDEFIIDKGSYHYLRDEVTQFLDIIETIGRTRDIRVLLLGNAISITNPYFAYFNLTLPYESEFKSFKNGLIVVNYIKNLEYRRMKKSSRFGRLIDGTDYGKYAIDNKFLRDNSTFIEHRTSDCKFWYLLVINGRNIGIWKNSNDIVYASDKFDPNTNLKFVMKADDHTPTTKFVNIRTDPFIKMVLTSYKAGCLRFENQKIKNELMFILNKCIAH